MATSPGFRPDPERVRQRLDARARLLNCATDEEFRDLHVAFDLCQVLGASLHTARECLEQPLNTLPDEAGVPAATVALWEHGLAMPEEITSGQITALVRWYVDRLRHQRHDGTVARLTHDLVVLYAELAGETLWRAPLR
jgi:hypothetical protein